MSYILDALKRSKQERELGQIPLLFSDSDIQTEPPQKKTNRVVLIALGLAMLAVAVSFYAAFGKHLLVAESEKLALTTPPTVNLPLSRPTPSIKEENLPTVQQQIDDSELAAVNEKMKPITVAKQTSDSGHEDSVADIQRLPVLDEQAEVQVNPTSTPLAYRDELLKLKQQIEQQEGETKARNAAEKSSKQESIHTPVAPDSVPQLEINRPVAEQQLAASFRSRIPSRNISVHVYSDNPAERFVFINSRKMAEGERTSEELMVEEIHPDGIVFSFEGKRFFKPL